MRAGPPARPTPRPAARLEEAKCDSEAVPEAPPGRGRGRGAGRGLPKTLLRHSPPRSGGPEVARAANSGVGGGQSQGPGSGGASPLNGGDGTAVGSGDGKRVGSTPRGAGGSSPHSPWPCGQHLGLLFHLSISLQGPPLSLPAMAGSGGGLIHDDLGLSPAPSEWGPEGRPGLQAGSLQTAPSPTAGTLPARPPLRQRVSPPPRSPA